jgi:hypothetical protein
MSLAHLLSAVSSFLVGVVLVMAPWWSGLWEANYLLQPYPLLRGLLLSPFTRGAISGLGLVNVLLAVHEVREQLSPRDEP